EDHRYPNRGGYLDQGQVDKLERRDLHRRHAYSRQAFDGVFVKRSGEEREAALSCVRGELGQPLPRECDLVEQLARATVVVEVLERWRLSGVEAGSRIELELHCLSSGMRRDVDQLLGSRYVAVVVRSRLGNDIDRLAGPDPAAGDLKRTGEPLGD